MNNGGSGSGLVVLESSASDKIQHAPHPKTEHPQHPHQHLNHLHSIHQVMGASDMQQVHPIPMVKTESHLMDVRAPDGSIVKIPTSGNIHEHEMMHKTLQNAEMLKVSFHF